MKVQHPGIVQLFGIYEGRTKLCIVMERAMGGDLFEYIVTENGVSYTFPLSPTRAATICFT